MTTSPWLVQKTLVTAEYGKWSWNEHMTKVTNTARTVRVETEGSRPDLGHASFGLPMSMFM